MYTNNFNESVTVSAPGYEILTGVKDKNNKDVKFSGTSAASTLLLQVVVIVLKTMDPKLDGYDTFNGGNSC